MITIASIWGLETTTTIRKGSEMDRYEFHVYLNGDGNSADEAWANACEALQLDGPGETPWKYTVEKVGEDDG